MGKKFMRNAVKHRLVRSSGTSRGAHIRALRAALAELLSLRSGEPPRAGGDVALRDHIAALDRAYPEFLAYSEVDAAWEEDTDASIPE